MRWDGYGQGSCSYFWDVLVPGFLDYTEAISVFHEYSAHDATLTFDIFRLDSPRVCYLQGLPQARERFWKPLPPGKQSLRCNPAHCQAHPSDTVSRAHRPVFGLHYVLPPPHAHLHCQQNTGAQDNHCEADGKGARGLPGEGLESMAAVREAESRAHHEGVRMGLELIICPMFCPCLILRIFEHPSDSCLKATSCRPLPVFLTSQPQHGPHCCSDTSLFFLGPHHLVPLHIFGDSL